MTSSTGRSEQSRPSSPATSSGRLTALSAPAVTAAGLPGEASSGSSRDKPPAAEPTTSASPAGGSMRDSARSALMTGAERQPFRAELDAVAGEHREPGGRCPRGELLSQPRLANARLTADEREHRVAAARHRHRGIERGKLLVPAHQDRADDPAAHEQHALTAARSARVPDSAVHQKPRIRERFGLEASRRSPIGSVFACVPHSLLPAPHDRQRRASSMRSELPDRHSWPRYRSEPAEPPRSITVGRCLKRRTYQADLCPWVLLVRQR